MSHPTRVRGFKYFKNIMNEKEVGRTLRGCVDLNYLNWCNYKSISKSHPTRVRGFKYTYTFAFT